MEGSEIGYLTWWNLPKRAWLIIIGELVVIIGLSTWIYATYINDLYFQAYTNSLAPVLVPVLSVGFGIASASLATYLYLEMKRINVVGHTERSSRKNNSQKKIATRLSPPTNSDSSLGESLALTHSTKLRPLGPIHKQAQRSQPKASQESASNEKRKDAQDPKASKHPE